jgi:hypothetical protein
MMVHILVRHKVKDYAKWKDAFDGHASMRRMAGSKGGRLFCDGKDPNDVAVPLVWEDIMKARAFFESVDLRSVMEQAGVIDEPQIFFEVNKVEA